MITGPENISTARERALGYQLALQEAGIARDPAIECRGPFLEQTGAEYTRALLDLDAPVEAIFTANLTITLGALHAIHERRLRVPEDVALVGMDEIPSTLPGMPAVTSVVQPTFEMGATGAMRLIQRLEKPGPHVRQEIVLAHHLRVGDSSRKR